jgi:hypothetical protein
MPGGVFERTLKGWTQTTSAAHSTGGDSRLRENSSRTEAPGGLGFVVWMKRPSRLKFRMYPKKKRLLLSPRT